MVDEDVFIEQERKAGLFELLDHLYRVVVTGYCKAGFLYSG